MYFHKNSLCTQLLSVSVQTKLAPDWFHHFLNEKLLFKQMRHSESIILHAGTLSQAGPQTPTNQDLTWVPREPEGRHLAEWLSHSDPTPVQPKDTPSRSVWSGALLSPRGHVGRRATCHALPELSCLPGQIKKHQLWEEKVPPSQSRMLKTFLIEVNEPANKVWSCLNVQENPV